MISDITIGQYFPGNSVIHKMDARMKIVLTLLIIVSLFLCRNLLSLAFVLVGIIAVIMLSRISFKTIFKSIKSLAVLIIITSVLNLFYGTGDPLVEFGRFAITENGIYKAVFMAVRIIALLIVGSMLTYTTTPTDLTDAIERLLKPLTYLKIDVHSFAMTMTIALRFIPTLVEEIDKIMSAQKSRGTDMESGNLINRAKALIPVLIPLFISSFRRAGELANAMECRCYRGGEGRTKMKTVKLCARDYVALAAVIIFFALIFVMNHLMPRVI